MIPRIPGNSKALSYELKYTVTPPQANTGHSSTRVTQVEDCKNWIKIKMSDATRNSQDFSTRDRGIKQDPTIYTSNSKQIEKHDLFQHPKLHPISTSPGLGQILQHNKTCDGDKTHIHDQCRIHMQEYEFNGILQHYMKNELPDDKLKRFKIRNPEALPEELAEFIAEDKKNHPYLDLSSDENLTAFVVDSLLKMHNWHVKTTADRQVEASDVEVSDLIDFHNLLIKLTNSINKKEISITQKIELMDKLTDKLTNTYKDCSTQLKALKNVFTATKLQSDSFDFDNFNYILGSLFDFVE